MASESARSRRRIACGVVAVMLLLAACRRDLPRPPHVVLVTIDALRARNLGCYGYPRPTSPAIDRFARDAVLFENTISVGGNTTTAMPGLFTGHYAFFEFNEPWTEAPFGMERFRGKGGGVGLPDDMTTLAESLASRGYRTAGFITNPYLKAALSMRQGFDHYQEIFNKKGVRFGRAEQVVEPALRYLGTVDWSEPTLLYLHFMDTHGPYRAPDPAVLGPLPAAFAQVRHHDLWKAWEKLENVGMGNHAFAHQYMTASYDSSLRHVDDAVSQILQYYRDHDLLDQTLFVLTADHGEEFLEHGGTTHKGTLFDELVEVPLVIRAPGGLRSTRLPQLVRNFDINPTILDYAGVPNPATTMDARSLRPLLEGQPFDGPKTVYAGFPWIRMIRTDHYKLLRKPDGNELFYDLTRDPEEATSLAQSTDANLQRVHDALSSLMDSTVLKLHREGVPNGGAARQAAGLDEGTREQLKSLGYLE